MSTKTRITTYVESKYKKEFREIARMHGRSMSQMLEIITEHFLLQYQLNSRYFWHVFDEVAAAKERDRISAEQQGD